LSICVEIWDKLKRKNRIGTYICFCDQFPPHRRQKLFPALTEYKGLQQILSKPLIGVLKFIQRKKEKLFSSKALSPFMNNKTLQK